MSGENPLIHCLDRLHLKDDYKLQQRAEKFQRQLESNVPPKVFNAGPNCKTVLAIHMASERYLLIIDAHTFIHLLIDYK